MQKLSCLLPKELKQLKFELDIRLRAAPWVSFRKVSVEALKCLSTCVDFSRSTRIFASFIIEMIGNETGPLHKFEDLSRKLINKCKT